MKKTYRELLEDTNTDQYSLINHLPYLAIVEMLGEINETLAKIIDALEPCPHCVNCCAPKDDQYPAPKEDGHPLDECTCGNVLDGDPCEPGCPLAEEGDA